MTSARPASSTAPSTVASWSVTPSPASSMITATWQCSIACSVLTIENFSTASSTLPRRRRPAVSIRRYLRPSRSRSTAIESRVVPGTSEAIIRSSPRMRFTSVDLPTFGRPTKATRMRSGSLSRISVSPSSGSMASMLRQQRVDAVLVRGRGRQHVLDAVAREFGQRRLHVDAVGLVDDEERRRGDLAQPAQDVVVERRGAFAAVDDEQDQVGFFRRGARLPRGRAGQAFFARRRCRRCRPARTGAPASSRQTP